MSRRIDLCTAVLCALALACAPQTSADKTATDSAAAAMADPAAARTAIEAANTRAEEALNKGDIEGWLTLYTSDAVVLPPNQPAWRGTEGLRSGAQAMLSEVALSDFDLNIEDVQVSGDFAVETGTYAMTMTPKKGGKAINDKGKYIVVWQRQSDGSWKAIRDMFNSDLPASS